MKPVLVTVAIAAALVSWQLFVPPLIGLADQGDFQKILGPLGYAPVPKGPEHKYWFLTRQFVKDPSYRQEKFEQLTSELIIAAPVITLSTWWEDQDRFDITIIGFAHAALFLTAFARLLYVTKQLRARPVIWALVLLILTDVGYVAYWNSLYTEPAACIWFLFLLSECINFANSGRISVSSISRFSLFGMLLITAKTQNALLCVPLGVYLAAVSSGARLRRIHYASFAGIASMLIAAIVMYGCLRPAPRVVSLYDVVFYGILPESPNPQADLLALGLSPEYVRYSGTLPWSEGTGVADGALVQDLLATVTPFSLVAFYLKRPARMIAHIEMLLPSYFSLRPEFCGNFEFSVKRRLGALSETVALWSYIHGQVISRIGLVILGFLPTAVLAGCVILIRNRHTASAARPWIMLATCLAACCLTAFFVAAFGDTYDNTKHQFLFNLLLDTCIVFGIASAATALQSRIPRRQHYTEKTIANPLRPVDVPALATDEYTAQLQRCCGLERSSAADHP